MLFLCNVLSKAREKNGIFYRKTLILAGWVVSGLTAFWESLEMVTYTNWSLRRYLLLHISLPTLRCAAVLVN